MPQCASGERNRPAS
ncbi:hypothetical protein YPPY103_4507, partial [Yersinia pestis PY-103]